MYWVQFGYITESGNLEEGVGDRAVIVLDGRESTTTHNAIARRECKKRGYGGYQLMRGDSFIRSRPIDPPVSLIY